MPFSTLTQRDKQAFFALLDEYFESRPGLLGGGEAGVASNANGAADTPPRTPARTPSYSSAPAPAPAKSRPTPPPAVPARTVTPRIVEPQPSHHESYTHHHHQEEEGEAEDTQEVDEAPVSVASRIRAAQAAIGNGHASPMNMKPPVPGARRASTQSNVSTTSSNPPPPPARSQAPPTPSRSPAPPSRTTSASSTNTNSAPSNGLVTSRGIGSIDTTSGGAAVTSVFKFKGMGKNDPPKSNGRSNVPPAFEKPKTRDTYAPPPRRGVNVEEPPEVQEEEEEAEEEQAVGEWVEGLYDLQAAEETDLSFKAGDQIWVTERTSKDWWMAEINGKTGLVPASYVKPL